MTSPLTPIPKQRGFDKQVKIRSYGEAAPCGVAKSYWRGCRCQLCRDANTAYKHRNDGLPSTARLTISQRFDKYEDDSAGPDACHPWTGAIYPNGRGKIQIGGRDGRCVSAARVALALALGLDTDELVLSFTTDLVAAHSCDNSWCVNPRHIVPMSQSDNLLDYCEKFGNTRSKRNGTRVSVP